jgi:2-oxoisovalerate dehydrogenase E2 component (dihydrolipoyl transacylase)
VSVGDLIEEDQPLVDVMTDKATVEMTTPVSGRVVALNGEPGDMAPVGSPLAVIAIDGAEAVEAVEAKPSSANIVPQPVAPASPAPRVAADRPLASPAVRRRAHELGIALQAVPGTGPAGRISHEDLDAFAAGGAKAPAAAPGGPARREGVEEIKVIGLRRKIAEKMQDAKRRIPHFAYVEEVDVTELEALRVHLNAATDKDRPRLTLLPFLIAALVKALPAFPQINARFDDEAGVVHRYAAVHVGVATQTANGLIVPVVRHAEARDPWDCAAEIARLAAATREGKAAADELKGSTITVTSLGPLGGIATTPVINHPEVAIIGPNRIVERPVVQGGGIVIRKMMNLSSSFDHRVVDGYDAAAFIQRVKALLEHPGALFLAGG